MEEDAPLTLVEFAGCSGERRLVKGLVVVVPFFNRGGEAHHRARALRAVVDNVAGWAPVVVSHQGEQPIEPRDGVVFLSNDDLGTDKFHKATLVNRGIDHFLGARGWGWMLQLDADILLPMDSLLYFLPTLGEDYLVASPWASWLRLEKNETEWVLGDTRAPHTFRAHPRRVVSGTGAGGLMLRRSLVEEGFRWDPLYADWGWEDTDAAHRAATWPTNTTRSVARGTATALHLWHENDRVVAEENGERFLGRELPEANLSRALLEAKTPYLIVCPGRSGGHLLSRSLNLLPSVHCDSNEPFTCESPPWPVGGADADLRQWTLLGPLRSSKPVVGMRMQPHIPLDKGYGFTGVDYIRWAHGHGFRLIYLYRDNVGEATCSLLLAKHHTSWIHDPYPEGVTTVDTRQVAGTLSYYREAKTLWRPFMEGLGAHVLSYESLCAEWESSLRGVMDFLGVGGDVPPQAIERQARLPYANYFTNWDGLQDSLRVASVRRVETITNLQPGPGRELGMVAVYFNSQGYRRLRENFLAFLERFRWMEDRMLVVELAYNGKPFELTGKPTNLLQLRSDSILWHKENLINVGTKVLRERGFDYVGWIDGDTILKGDGEGWYPQVCDLLRQKKLVQLCEWIEHRYSDQADRHQSGMANFLGDNDIPVGQVYKTGLGWAVRGGIWDRCGWYDQSIMGSGDRMLFLASVLSPGELDAIAQKVTCLKADSCGLSEYSAWAKAWQTEVGGSVSYLPGVEAVAESHGAHADRQYYEREQELAGSGFKSSRHLLRDESGLLCWSVEAPDEVKQMLVDYFVNRREDE